MGREVRGRFFRRRGVAAPFAAKKLFTSFTDGRTFCGRRIYATDVRTLLSLSARLIFLFFVTDDRVRVVFVGAPETRCVYERGVRCVHPGSQSCCDSWHAGRPRLRWTVAVAINTRRTSAPVDFGQSFAGESVRSAAAVAASERRRRRGRGGRRSALCGRGGLGLKPPKDKTYK